MEVYQAEFEGRSYTVEINPENVREPFHQYCSVFRKRKDGSRGMRLMSHRPEAWAIFNTVRTRVDADHASSNNMGTVPQAAQATTDDGAGAADPPLERSSRSGSPPDAPNLAAHHPR